MERRETLDDFLAPFEPARHEAIAANVLKDGVDGVVEFARADGGRRLALVYGPGCTTKAVAEIAGQRLEAPGPPGDWLDPVAYYAKPALPAPL